MANKYGEAALMASSQPSAGTPVSRWKSAMEKVRWKYAEGLQSGCHAALKSRKVHAGLQKLHSNPGFWRGLVLKGRTK